MSAHSNRGDGERLRFHRTDAPEGMAVQGEIDAVNRDTWITLLDTLVKVPGPITLDLRDVTFIDGSGAWLVTDLVRRRAGHPTKIVCTPAAAALLRLIVRDSPGVLGDENLLEVPQP